jgi:cyclic pyranopterin phosphate synthase
VTLVALGLPGLPGPDPTQAAGTAARPTTETDFPQRPDAPGLIDRFGRVATDLRLSVTDRCNLRCTYCMPEEGPGWLPRGAVLTAGELVRLAAIAVTQLGITEVRLTGGEPLLRPDLEEIVAGIAALAPRPEIAVTTNAVGLAGRAARLRAAGVDRVNVSLDTVRPEAFAELTRRTRLDNVLAGLADAATAGLTPVKVNAVLMPGVTELDALPLLELCLQHSYELRFIEQMPLDAQRSWQRSLMVTAEEVLAVLRSNHRLDPDPGVRGGSPAKRWLVDGGPATVGIIASVSEPFCSACDRTRVTADGQVRSCLFGAEETDLRTALRSGASDQALADLWRGAMWRKPAGHGIDDADFAQPARPMSAIGG